MPPCSHQAILQISGFYRRFGMFTLIIGRFVPFGVRNGLLLAAGLENALARLLLADLIAVGASTGGYFWLYLNYGDDALRVVQENQWIFVPLALGIVLFPYEATPAHLVGSWCCVFLHPYLRRLILVV